MFYIGGVGVDPGFSEVTAHDHGKGEGQSAEVMFVARPDFCAI